MINYGLVGLEDNPGGNVEARYVFGVKDAVDETDRRAEEGRGIPRWLFPTLAVVILGVGGFFLIRHLNAPAPAAAPQTAVVTRGLINSTVSATGSVVAPDNASLGFRAPGRVAEVDVKPGDRVQAGQVLAKLDTTDVALQVTQQRAALASAQAKLDSIKAGPRAEDVAAAQAAVANAQASLDNVNAGATSADISAAQQAVQAASSQVQTARDSLSKLKNGATSQDLRNAELQVTQANNSLAADRKQRDYTCGQKPDAVTGLPTQATINANCDAAKAKVTYDTTQVSIAQNNLAKLKTPATAAAIAAATDSVHAAENSYNAAVARLNDLKDGPSAPQLAAAQSQLAQAQANLAKTQKPYTDTDLQVAQATVDQAQAQLDLARFNLSNATLTAPFAGTVGAVNVIEGVLTSGTTPAIVLVNPNDIRLDVNVDETDVANVATGQKARVAFDALPTRQFDGVITAVAPNATIQAGVATYTVSVKIANAEGVRPGMTGNAGIIYAEKSDALLVPNRAIHRSGKDRYVQVLVGGKEEIRPVTIGMANEQETEIVEGVAEGETVVIATTTSFQFTPPSRATATPRPAQ